MPKDYQEIEELIQIFQHEYGQYTSLEALSIASDWLRNTLYDYGNDRVEEIIKTVEGMKGEEGARLNNFKEGHKAGYNQALTDLIEAIKK
jgi:hypothetical protein